MPRLPCFLGHGDSTMIVAIVLIDISIKIVPPKVSTLFGGVR